MDKETDSYSYVVCGEGYTSSSCTACSSACSRSAGYDWYSAQGATPIYSEQALVYYCSDSGYTKYNWRYCYK